MKKTFIILLGALALTGCATYQGGAGAGDEDEYGQVSTTDFGRGGNRANPPPYDTQSGAMLPQTEEDVPTP